MNNHQIEFNVHSNVSPMGYFSVESLTRALDEAQLMWKQAGRPITVVIDLVVMQYGRIVSQRSVYLFTRSKPWPG